MPVNQITTPVIKLCVLCLIGWLIWYLSQTTAHGLTKFDIEEAAEQTQPEVPVHVGIISQKPMHAYLTVFGTVEPAPATTDAPPAGATISTATRSVVTDVSCIEGQLVTKGQPLFTVANGATNTPVVVTSPLAGTVIRLLIRPGEIANPKSAAVEIVDLRRLVITADVPGFDLDKIRIGETAVVDAESSDSIAPPKVTGSVNRIDSQIDAATGMGSVDITAPTGMTLRPGQPVRVKIAITNHETALTVPADSIVHDSQGRPAVAALIRNGRWAELQPVEIGLREGESVEIRGRNFVAGQFIVTGGAYALPESAAIRVLKD